MDISARMPTLFLEFKNRNACMKNTDYNVPVTATGPERRLAWPNSVFSVCVVCRSATSRTAMSRSDAQVASPEADDPNSSSRAPGIVRTINSSNRRSKRVRSPSLSRRYHTPPPNPPNMYDDLFCDLGPGLLNAFACESTDEVLRQHSEVLRMGQSHTKHTRK